MGGSVLGRARTRLLVDQAIEQHKVAHSLLNLREWGGRPLGIPHFLLNDRVGTIDQSVDRHCISHSVNCQSGGGRPPVD